MTKNFLISTLLIFAVTTSFAAYNLSPADNISLAKRCNTLASKIVESSFDYDSVCGYLLENAADDLVSAGLSIFKSDYPDAKKHLKDSSDSLKYATAINCGDPTETTYAINEILQIDSQIIF